MSTCAEKETGGLIYRCSWQITIWKAFQANVMPLQDKVLLGFLARDAIAIAAFQNQSLFSGGAMTFDTERIKTPLPNQLSLPRTLEVPVSVWVVRTGQTSDPAAKMCWPHDAL